MLFNLDGGSGGVATDICGLDGKYFVVVLDVGCTDRNALIVDVWDEDDVGWVIG